MLCKFYLDKNKIGSVHILEPMGIYILLTCDQIGGLDTAAVAEGRDLLITIEMGAMRIYLGRTFQGHKECK